MTTLYAQEPEWIITGITDSAVSVSGDAELIWTATLNDGIKSFNKVTGEIEIYNVVNNSFPSNKFRVVKYLNGKVYAGSFYNGYFVYENNTWTTYDTINSPLPANNVTDFEYQSDENIVWIATDKGLIKKVNDDWQLFDTSNSAIAGNILTCLHLDRDQTLWIGTLNAGLSKYADGVFTTYNYDNAGINDNWIRTIYSDTSGIMYIADYFGVDKYDPVSDTWQYVFNTTTSGLTSNQINKMAFDADHNLWFVSHSGVTKWDMDLSWEQFYSTNSPLPHNTTDGLFIDDENIVWIASFGGLAGYNSDAVQFPVYEDKVIAYPNPFTNSIQVDIVNGDKITVYDLTGKSMFTQTISAEITGEFSIDIDLSHLAHGIYFIQVLNDQSAITIKVMKL